MGIGIHSERFGNITWFLDEVWRTGIFFAGSNPLTDNPRALCKIMAVNEQSFICDDMGLRLKSEVP
jgi:hypothetical protein